MLTKLPFVTITVLLCLSVLSVRGYANDLTVPLDLQAKLFLKALTYDKNLKKQDDNHLTIGVLHFPGQPQSKECATGFYEILEMFKDKTISGLGIQTVLYEYDTPELFRKMISREGVDVVYIAAGPKARISEVIRITQSEKVFSCTGVVDYVTESGVSMSVGVLNKKPRIYLNLSSAKAEGADLGAQFLRITKIVESEDKQKN